jgi:photosystem II stability/assembly factor-like uncharacterized protein
MRNNEANRRGFLKKAASGGGGLLIVAAGGVVYRAWNQGALTAIQEPRVSWRGSSTMKAGKWSLAFAPGTQRCRDSQAHAAAWNR